MSQTDEEFQFLMDRVRDGDPDAANELFDLYHEDIRRIVRWKLTPRLRTHYDSEDITQDVWASFYAVSFDDREFETQDELFAYLAEVATNKVIERYRQRCQTQKHNLERVRSLDGSAALEAHAQASPQATPSRVAVAREQLARLLEGKPEPFQRLILLAASGHTQEEIGRELGLSARYVRHLLDRLTRRKERTEEDE